MRRLFWVLILGLAGCGGSQKVVDDPPRPKPSLAGRTAADDLVGIFSGGTVGPYLGTTASGWLAVWVATEGDQATWTVRNIDAAGHVSAPAEVVANAQHDTHLLKLLKVDDELLVLFTDGSPGQQRVGGLSLTQAGQLASSPVAFPRAARDVVWLDAIGTGSAALAFWAERKKGSAELYAARWQPDAAGSSVNRVHAEARAWQVAPMGQGALLAVVTSDLGIELTHIDASGRFVDARALPDSRGANPDVDLVRRGDGFVVAYSRAVGGQDRVFTVRLDAQGEPLGPAQFATEPLGSQRVVRMLSSGERSLLVWSTDVQSNLRAAWLDAEGKASGKSVELKLGENESVPEFASNSRGATALLGARCAKAPCPRTPALQWFEEPLQTRVEDWSRASVGLSTSQLVWGLSCAEKSCASLSAELGDPIAVHVKVSGAVRAASTVPVKPAATAVAVPDDAWLSTEPLKTLVQTPPLADFAVSRRESGALVTWLTEFDPNTPYVKPDRPAPDGRWAPVQALLQTQWLPDGAALPVLETLSYRARSVSGIALAQKGERELLVWSAFDGKSPQVFTTLLDPQGKRVRQAVQTTKPGEVFKVAAAALDEGWVIGWIDDRSAHPVSYVAQLNERLMRLSPDLPYPSLEGEATDQVVARVGAEIWVLALEVAAERSALVLQRFDKALQPIGTALPLVSAAGRLSSPALSETADGAALLWLAGEGASSQAWYQALDGQAKTREQPVALARGTQPVALDLECKPTGSCGFWLSERSARGVRVLGGPLGSNAPQVLFAAKDPRVPLVRVDGSELWVHQAKRGLARSRVEALGSASSGN
jgi:hypothetical protein